MANSATPILLVEDDEGLRRQMQWALAPNPVLAASNRTEALGLFEANAGEPIVVLDLGLPPDPDGTSEGLQVLETIVDNAPHTKVIIGSGHNDRSAAISAVGR